MDQLKAPFPWFGGKSKAVDLVWPRFGQVKNYVEPFFGSGAMLFGGPGVGVETINDLDGFVANAWRSIKLSPNETAVAADWPVNEADLHARHVWLLDRREELLARLMGQADYHDPKIAGYWIWGQCTWIGQGWCSGKGPWQSIDGVFEKRPKGFGDAGKGVRRQRPHLSCDNGVHRSRKRPHLNASGVSRNIDIHAWFSFLSDRLRRVRVCCGDWSRVCGVSVTYGLGLTAVFLDPPYSNNVRASGLYSEDCGDVATDCRQWAIDNGDNPLMRIALCGYQEEHVMPAGWTVAGWSTQGGYSNRNKTNANKHKETIWFSPHCLDVDQRDGRALKMQRTPVKLNKKKWATDNAQVVLGVDPGIRGTGVAVVVRESDCAPLRVLHGEVISTKPLAKKHRRSFRQTNDRQRRHKEIWNQICSVATQYQVNAVGVEAYIINVGQRGSVQGAQALGIYCGVLWWAWERNLYAASFLPSDLKKRFCGKQSATKEEVTQGILHEVAGVESVLDKIKPKEREHVSDAVGHAVLALDEIDATKQMLGL